MAYGKKIELFLVNGTADGLVTAELSNWNGEAFKIPRIEVKSCDCKNITKAGVYFLFCKEDDGTDSVYIGESENVKDRLIQHIHDYQADKEEYYWTTAVIFIGRDLNKTLIRYLESRLVKIANSCRRYKILTKNTYKNIVMKKSDRAAMEEFIDDIKVVINALGYKVLESLIKHDSANSSNDDDWLYINSGTAKATGKTTTEGFVVLQGTVINKNMSTQNKRIINLRDKWILEDKVKYFVTTEDLLFSSSSAAADFVLGYSASGPGTWKDKNGKLLKEIEAEKNE